MHARETHPLQSTFVSEDADPKTASLWIRRGERLADRLLAFRVRITSFLSPARKADGDARMAAR